jgi:Peptidase family S41/N-terminal domain of Peptidase_S41 in eukaryotic IRBP
MKDIVGSAVALLSILTLTQARSITKQTAISLPSNNPVSSKFSGWLSAFNTADEATILDFYASSYNVSDSDPKEKCCTPFTSPKFIAQMANWTGGFNLVDLESDPEDPSLTALLKAEFGRFREYFRVTMAVDEEAPGQPITKLELLPISRPLKMVPMDDPRREVYEKALQPLTAELREKLIREITRMMRDQYADPQRGEEMAALLEKNLEVGDYDSISDSDNFSRKLMRDLMTLDEEDQNSSGPGMYIGFHEPFSVQYADFEEGEEKQAQKLREYYEEVGYGFGNVSFDTEAIAGKTIATLPITHLLNLDDPGVRDAAAAKLNSVADADVLIIDVRNCFGGYPDTTAFVLSYLFDHEMTLTYLKNRNNVYQNISATLPLSKLPAGAKIFGGQKPLYVLTNNRTLLEAELVAYSLQAFGRAVIVGEQEATGGLAHPPGDRFTLCEEDFGKEWWSVDMETQKLVHVATKDNWDHKGVKSDIVVDETVEEEHCRHKARLAAIEYERNRGTTEVQDELR